MHLQNYFAAMLAATLLGAAAPVRSMVFNVYRLLSKLMNNLDFEISERQIENNAANPDNSNTEPFTDSPFIIKKDDTGDKPETATDEEFQPDTFII